MMENEEQQLQQEMMLGETNLFDPTLLQLGILNEFDREYAPQAAIQKDMPIEFIIKGAAQHYIDLNNTRLKVKCKIVKPDGTAIDGHYCGPVNNILHSMWQDVQVSLRGRTVSDPSNLYPYRAYLSTLLNYGEEVWKSRLLSEGWVSDIAKEVMNDPNTDGANTSLTTRATWFEQSKMVCLIGRPHCDIFHQGKLLPPGIDMTVKLFPSEPKFGLLCKKDRWKQRRRCESQLPYRDCRVYPHYAHQTTYRVFGAGSSADGASPQLSYTQYPRSNQDSEYSERCTDMEFRERVYGTSSRPSYRCPSKGQGFGRRLPGEPLLLHQLGGAPYGNEAQRYKCTTAWIPPRF